MAEVPYRRIVLKLGTNTLCDADGLPDHDLLQALADEIHRLRSDGHQVLIVSSGAIGFGRAGLGLTEVPLDIPTRQAAAAVGQPHLVGAWERAFKAHGIPVGQVLVTSHTFHKRSSYLDLRNCIESLLKHGAVPIVNENDTISTEEIDAAFTDNDRLGALLAGKVEADLYIILSDVQGLFDAPPDRADAKRVPRVAAVTKDVLAMAGPAGKKGRGGMRSKLESAQHLMEAGVPVVIAYGRSPGILHAILAGEDVGTWFEAVGRQDGRERWLKAAVAQGRIVVDEGAVEALRDGGNLLPAGVQAVEGAFPVESVVEITHDGRVVGRAQCLLSSRDLERCLGMRSAQAKKALGIEGSVNLTRKGRLLMH